MKKFALVCLLALPLTALSQQTASAWFNLKVGAAVGLGVSFGGWEKPFSHCGYCPPPADPSAAGSTAFRASTPIRPPATPAMA